MRTRDERGYEQSKEREWAIAGFGANARVFLSSEGVRRSDSTERRRAMQGGISEKESQA